MDGGVVEDLEAAIDTALGFNLAELTPRERRRAAALVGRLDAKLTALRSGVIGEFDARKDWSAIGYPSPSPRADVRKVAQAERTEILSGLALFDGAAKRHLREIARQTRLEQFDPDQDLLVEGQPSSSAFVIVAGRAAVRRNGRKVAEVGPGDIVGELGLLGDRPRNATVRATGPMECLALDREALKAAVLKHPALGWLLLGTVAERLTG